jgi:hypothetical protein
MSSGVFISVDKDGWTGGIQIAIDMDGGGYRLAGPSYNGSSATLKRHELSLRDCNELERAVKVARANLVKPAAPTPTR